MKNIRKFISISFISLVILGLNLFAQAPNGSNQSSPMIKTVVALTGKVTDGITKTPVSVKLYVLDNDGKKTNSTNSNSDDGYYYVTKLIPGEIYKLFIEGDQFLNNEYEIKIPSTDKYLEFTKDFVVYPKVANTSIRLKVPPFELNKSKIKFGYAILMDDYLALLQANPTVNFTIECYPDDKMDPGANMKLTKLRAQNLSDFFEINGIDPQRITIKANSEPDPKNPLPETKSAKGKRYIGTTYLVIN